MLKENFILYLISVSISNLTIAWNRKPFLQNEWVATQVPIFGDHHFMAVWVSTMVSTWDLFTFRCWEFQPCAKQLWSPKHVISSFSFNGILSSRPIRSWWMHPVQFRDLCWTRIPLYPLRYEQKWTPLLTCDLEQERWKLPYMPWSRCEKNAYVVYRRLWIGSTEHLTVLYNIWFHNI